MENNTTCPKCKSKFQCGATETGPCWCNSYPPIMPIPTEDEEAACFCPKCLAALIEKSENGSKFADSTEK